MRRRNQRLVGLGMALALGSAACGGSSEPAADDAPETAPAATASPEEPGTVSTAPPATDAPATSDVPAVASAPYTLDLPGGAALTIPAGAPEGITATALDVVPPDGFTVLAAFELAPAGLVFDDPVQLTVPLPTPETDTIVGYSAVLVDADGTEEFVDGAVGDDGTATVDIEHFSSITVLSQSVTMSSSGPVAVVGEPVERSIEELMKKLRPQRLEYRAEYASDHVRGVVGLNVESGELSVTCLRHGDVSTIAVFDAPPGGQIFGALTKIELLCEAPPENLISIAADQTRNTENHTDSSLLQSADWLSAWTVQFPPGFAGTAASVVDVSCDGIGVDDIIVFGPEMVMPSGTAVLGLERFGCNGLLLFPPDSDVGAITFPWTVQFPPVLRENDTWTLGGELDELGATFVFDMATGEIATWRVTGSDGEMPRTP